MEPKNSRPLKWAIIIGIIILLNLFFNYALSLVYKAPAYETYCPSKQVNLAVTNQNQCIAQGGQWTENVYPKENLERPNDRPTPEVQGYCNPTYTCQKDFETAHQAYQRNVFIVLVVLGIVSIVVGMILRMASVVSIALSLGGVLSLIIAAIRYWSAAENVLRVVILGFALVALIWLGIKKFRDDGYNGRV